MVNGKKQERNVFSFRFSRLTQTTIISRQCRRDTFYYTHTHIHKWDVPQLFLAFIRVKYTVHTRIHEICLSDTGKATRVTTTRGDEEKIYIKLISTMGVVSCIICAHCTTHTTVTGVPNKKVSDFRGHCCATRIWANLKFSKCQWVFFPTYRIISEFRANRVQSKSTVPRKGEHRHRLRAENVYALYTTRRYL